MGEYFGEFDFLIKPQYGLATDDLNSPNSYRLSFRPSIEAAPDIRRNERN
jgi:hypothetical protein